MFAIWGMHDNVDHKHFKRRWNNLQTLFCNIKKINFKYNIGGISSQAPAFSLDLPICNKMGTIFQANVVLWKPIAQYVDQSPVHTGTDDNFGSGVQFRTKVSIEFRLGLGLGLCVKLRL